MFFWNSPSQPMWWGERLTRFVAAVMCSESWRSSERERVSSPLLTLCLCGPVPTNQILFRFYALGTVDHLFGCWLVLCLLFVILWPFSGIPQKEPLYWPALNVSDLIVLTSAFFLPFSPLPSSPVLTLHSPGMIPYMLMASFSILKLITPKFISSTPASCLMSLTQFPPGWLHWVALQVPQSLACPQRGSDSPSSHVCFGLFSPQILGSGANIHSLLQAGNSILDSSFLNLLHLVSTQASSVLSFWVHPLLCYCPSSGYHHLPMSASVAPLPSSLCLVCSPLGHSLWYSHRDLSRTQWSNPHSFTWPSRTRTFWLLLVL